MPDYPLAYTLCFSCTVAHLSNGILTIEGVKRTSTAC